MELHHLRDDPATWHILEERARALAAHQEAEKERVQGEEVITFRIGESGFSVPVQFVREVQPLQHWTPLPTTPSFVVGLVNVRGKILTALDVRPLLNIAQTGMPQQPFLIILSVQGVEVGLLAESVVTVRHTDSELAPTLSSLAGHGVSWVLGLDHALNLVLDPPTLLTDPRVVVNDDTA